MTCRLDTGSKSNTLLSAFVKSIISTQIYLKPLILAHQ